MDSSQCKITQIMYYIYTHISYTNQYVYVSNHFIFKSRQEYTYSKSQILVSRIFISILRCNVLRDLESLLSIISRDWFQCKEKTHEIHWSKFCELLYAWSSIKGRNGYNTDFCYNGDPNVSHKFTMKAWSLSSTTQWLKIYKVTKSAASWDNSERKWWGIGFSIVKFVQFYCHIFN